MKIRYLTFSDVVNNGSILQAVALQEYLRRTYPEHDVRTLSYTVPKARFREVLKLGQWHLRKPWFNIRRYRIFRDFVQNRLDWDDSVPSFVPYRRVTEALNRSGCDMLFVGSDVWALNSDIHRPGFPNPYWIPEDVTARKVAFGISAYNSDVRVFRRNAAQLRSLLSRFEFVGAREEETYRLVEPYVPSGRLYRTPDAAFFYRHRPTDLVKKLEQNGVDASRRILLVLFPGSHPILRAYIDGMRARGYQVVGTGMYNRDVDVNLGDVLDPFEWAEMFKLASMSVTMLMHGTIFAMLAGTPFIALDIGMSPEHSKKLQMLAELGVPDLLFDLSGGGGADALVRKHDDIAGRWTDDYQGRIREAVAAAAFRNGRLLSDIIH